MLLTLAVCIIHEEYMNLNCRNLEKESVIFGQLASSIAQGRTWEVDVRASSNISCPLWRLKVSVPCFYEPATEPSHALYLMYSDSDRVDCADDVTLAVYTKLALNLLMWRIWWAPNNASKWQMGFNSAFKGLKVQISNVQKVVISEVSLPDFQDNMLLTVFTDFFFRCFEKCTRWLSHW